MTFNTNGDILPDDIASRQNPGTLYIHFVFKSCIQRSKIVVSFMELQDMATITYDVLVNLYDQAGTTIVAWRDPRYCHVSTDR